MTTDGLHLDDARRDELSAYALGALPEDEAAALDAHLVHCDTCRVHLRLLEPALDALASSGPQESPPARVRESLIAAVRAEAEAESQAMHTRRDSTTTDPWWRRIATPALRPTTALAAIVLLAAGVGGGYLLGEEGAGTDESSTRIVSAEPLAGNAAPAQLEIRDDSAVLEVRRLPELPTNRVYQVWIERGGALQPSTIFVLDDSGSGIAAVPESLQGAERVLVTAEPQGGSEQPTGLPVLAARLS